MSTQIWKLSPSDFAFLWEDCRRCFFLKVVRDFRHPRKPMAKVFKEIDAEMRTHFEESSGAERGSGQGFVFNEIQDFARQLDQLRFTQCLRASMVACP